MRRATTTSKMSKLDIESLPDDKLDTATKMLDEYSQILIDTDKRIAELEAKIKARPAHNQSLQTSLNAARKKKLMTHKFLEGQLLSRFGSIQIGNVSGASIVDQAIQVSKYLKEVKNEHKKLAEELNLEDFDVSEEMEQLKKDIALEDEIIHRSYRRQAQYKRKQELDALNQEELGEEKKREENDEEGRNDSLPFYMELAKSGDVGTPPPASKSQQEELAEFIKEINDKEKRNKKIAKGKKKGACQNQIF